MSDDLFAAPKLPLNLLNTPYGTTLFGPHWGTINSYRYGSALGLPLPTKQKFEPPPDPAPIGRILDWSQIGYPSAIGQPIPKFRGSSRFIGQLMWVGEVSSEASYRFVGEYIDFEWTLDLAFGVTQTDPRGADFEARYGPLGLDNPNYRIDTETRGYFENEYTVYKVYIVDRAYNGQFAVAFAENFFDKEIGLYKLYAGDVVIYDAATGEQSEAVDFVFYSGLNNPRDPTILGIEGEELTPKFKKICYIVFREFDPTVFNFEVPVISALLGEGDGSQAEIKDNLIHGYESSNYDPTDYEAQGATWGLAYSNQFGGDIGLMIAERYETDWDGTQFRGIGWSYTLVDTATGNSDVHYDMFPDIYDDFVGDIYDFPHKDEAQSSFPLLTPGAWADFPYDWSIDVAQFFVGYQPKGGGYPRGIYIATQYSSQNAHVYNMVEIDQSGSNEETPVWCGWADADEGYLMQITCRGPRRISVYGFKLNFDGDFFFYGEFVDADYNVVAGAEADVLGITVGPKTNGGGKLFYIQESDDIIREISYSTGDGSWDFTRGGWRELITVPTGIWYDPGFDLLAVSLENGMCQVFHVTSNEMVLEVELPVGFKVLPLTIRDNVSIAASTHVKRGIATTPGFCFLVSEDGMIFRTLDMREGTITPYVALDPTTTDQWGSAWLNMPAGETYQITKQPTTNPDPDYVGRAEFSYVSYSAGGGGMAAGFTIQDLLYSLALKMRYPEEDIEFVGLSPTRDICYGWALYNDSDYRSIMREVCDLYGIVIVDTGEAIRFVKAETDDNFALSAEMDETDLVAINGDGGALVQSYRIADIEIPRSFQINYADATNDMTDGVALVQRPSGHFEVTASQRRFTAQSPVSLAPGLAKRLAYKQLYQLVSRGNRHLATVGPEHIGLEPGDVVSIPAGGFTRYCQIVQTTLNPDFSMQIEMEEFLTGEETDIDEEIEEDGTPVGDHDLLAAASPQTQLKVLDIPLIEDGHSSGELAATYLYMTGEDTGWAGGTVYERQGDETFAAVAASLPGYPAIAEAGEAPTFDAAKLYQIDEDAEIEVTITAGASSYLHTKTTAEVLAGENRVAYGAAGRWEIIAYTTAEKVSGNTYRLSGLLRGLRGTEGYISLHEEGDTVVPLDVIYRKGFAPEALGATDFKAVGAGASVASATTQTVTLTGESLRPYAPAHLAAEDDGSSGIDITATRRSRIGGPKPFHQPPLAEATEEYEVDILDAAASPPSLLRAVTGLSSPAYNYTAAQIASDGSPAAVIIRMFQISAAVGRGHAAEITHTF